MRLTVYSLILIAMFAAGCAPTMRRMAGPTVTSHSNLPGKQPDGSVLLPNQWSLRPVGRQVELGDFPINIAVHPRGRFAAVLHSGFSEHQIIIVDVSSAQIVSRTGVSQAFYGLEFSRDGKRLFCSGAGEEVVHSFEFQNGSLSNHTQIKLREVKERGVPAGLALDSGGRRLFVANVWGDRITRIDLLPEPKTSDILFGTNAAALSTGAAESSPDFDTAAATKRAAPDLFDIRS
jgi:WD40 repeat protein